MSQPLDPLRELPRVEPVTAPVRVTRRRDRKDEEGRRRDRQEESRRDEQDDDDGVHIDVLA